LSVRIRSVTIPWSAKTATARSTKAVQLTAFSYPANPE